MRRLCIGDPHGQLGALKQVLKLAKFNKKKDLLIVLGDVVDGGKDSKGVIDELLKIKHCELILGNHDKWFVQHIKEGFREEIWLQQGGADTLISYGGKIKRLGNNWNERSIIDISNVFIPVTHQEFLNNAKHYIELDNMLFVHGGFRKELHPKDETEFNLIWDRQLIEVAIQYDQIGKKIGKWDKIFVGHTTTQRFCGETTPVKFANLIMLDCGAGWNGRLAIMDIDTEEYWISDLQKGRR